MTDHRLIASGTNENVQIFLDRWDYKTYTVSIHEKGHEAIHEDFDCLTWSYKRFFEACSEHRIKPKKEI